MNLLWDLLFMILIKFCSKYTIETIGHSTNNTITPIAMRLTVIERTVPVSFTFICNEVTKLINLYELKICLLIKLMTTE